MRVFKSKAFSRFARKEGISKQDLLRVVQDTEGDKIHADYGGGLIKQKIARQNRGKSSGFRTLLLFKKGHRCFFAYGFAKSEADNIDDVMERDLKDLAKVLLNLPEEEIDQLVKSGAYQEVKL